MKGFTLQYLEKQQKEGLIVTFEIPGESKAEKKKRTKFGNKTTVVDGISFDSNREARRYRELLLLMKVGEIGQLKLQQEFELNNGGTHSLKYIADFTYYTKSGEYVVEDSKGFRTNIYKKKCRLMKKVHGIIIKET
jgi:hypothetical protein